MLHNNAKTLECLTEHRQHRLQNIVLSFENDVRDDPAEYLQHQLEFYASIMFHHLRLNMHSRLDTEVVLQRKQFKTLFCGPERQIVQFEEKTSESLLKFRNTADSKSPFVLENYPFERLLQKLSPKRIVMLF